MLSKWKIFNKAMIEDEDLPRKALEDLSCLNPSKVITRPNFPDEEAEDEAPDELSGVCDKADTWNDEFAAED